MSKKILIVEDDVVIAEGLKFLLGQEGYFVDHAANCHTANEMLNAASFDLVLLDLNLPDGSGYDLCRSLREKGSTPVIILTALSQELNVVKGLELGADDYISKPFRSMELLSRVHSVLRRYERGNKLTQTQQFGDLIIDPSLMKVNRGNTDLALTALEYKLLLIFASHPGRVYTRAQLLEALWAVGGDYCNDNTLTVYIKRLREKIEIDPQNPRLILTERGLGYKGSSDDL